MKESKIYVVERMVKMATTCLMKRPNISQAVLLCQSFYSLNKPFTVSRKIIFFLEKGLTSPG